MLLPQTLSGMLECYSLTGASIVGCVTRIEGASYLARAMDAYRVARFRPGPALVVGTPTLIDGELLRANPYRPERRFSDDAELCERWALEFEAHFEIAPVEALEVGKIDFKDVWSRWKMYGVSDAEVYRAGAGSGWSRRRKAQSILYPVRREFIGPVRSFLSSGDAKYIPFLGLVAARRYMAWAERAVRDARRG